VATTESVDAATTIMDVVADVKVANYTFFHKTKK